MLDEYDEERFLWAANMAVEIMGIQPRTGYLCPPVLSGKDQQIWNMADSEFVLGAGACRSRQELVMSFEGVCGNGSSTDTSFFGPPGAAANSRLAAPVFATWREDQSKLHNLLNTRHEDDAIAELSKVPSFGGTGFRAKTVIHALTELDKRRAIERPGSHPVFAWAFGREGVRVGPNPRAMLNVCEQSGSLAYVETK